MRRVVLMLAAALLALGAQAEAEMPAPAASAATGSAPATAAPAAAASIAAELPAAPASAWALPTLPQLPEMTSLSSSATEMAREFQRGVASWYGPGFHGRKTASGERFDQHALTAAHPSLPFGTIVRVSLENGRSIDVRINDRGPFLKRRIIDLSRAAADALGIIQSGLGVKLVTISVLQATGVKVNGPADAAPELK